MKKSILRIIILYSISAAALYGYVAHEWPKPVGGTVFTTNPVEKHTKIATSLLRSGDTLWIVRDGKRHYWNNPMRMPSGLSNVTIRFSGLCFCSGIDLADCDVVINENDGLMMDLK